MENDKHAVLENDRLTGDNNTPARSLAKGRKEKKKSPYTDLVNGDDLSQRSSFNWQENSNVGRR